MSRGGPRAQRSSRVPANILCVSSGSLTLDIRLLSSSRDSGADDPPTEVFRTGRQQSKSLPVNGLSLMSRANRHRCVRRFLARYEAASRCGCEHSRNCTAIICNRGELGRFRGLPILLSRPGRAHQGPVGNAYWPALGPGFFKTLMRPVDTSAGRSFGAPGLTQSADSLPPQNMRRSEQMPDQSTPSPRLYNRPPQAGFVFEEDSDDEGNQIFVPVWRGPGEAPQAPATVNSDDEQEIFWRDHAIASSFGPQYWVNGQAYSLLPSYPQTRVRTAPPKAHPAPGEMSLKVVSSEPRIVRLSADQMYPDGSAGSKLPHSSRPYPISGSHYGAKREFVSYWPTAPASGSTSDPEWSPASEWAWVSESSPAWVWVSESLPKSGSAAPGKHAMTDD